MKNKLLLMAMGIAFNTQMIIAQVPSYVPTNGLVGYWPFSGNANDASVNANNGNNIGATLTTDRFGNSNNAYSFDGASNYIDLTNSNFNILGNANRTLSAWAKTSVNGKGIFATGNAASNCPDSNNGKTFNIVQNNDRLGLMGFNCGACPTCDFYPVNGQVVVDNNWNFLVLVLENGTLRTYVNGVLDNTSSMPLLNTQNNFNFIGKTNHIGDENYFNGKIDDVGIWNRALTQNEIISLYQSEVSCQSLVINSGTLSSFNPPVYQSTVTIYPNPANDQITIDCGNLANVSGWTISIINTLGQEVFSGAMNTQQYVVPLNSWSGQGVYFVKIYDASNNLLNTKKIILQ